MLANLINNSKYTIFFPIIDQSLGLSITKLTNLYLIYSQPPKTTPSLPYFVCPQKIKAKTEYLLGNPSVVDYITTTCKKTGKLPAIMPFKPSSKTDLICHQYNWLKIGIDRRLNLKLEDKVNFAKICHQVNIPAIPNIITTYTPLNISQAQQFFGTKQLVIQTKTGWAGNNTFMFDPNLSLPTNAQIKIMPYLKGFAITTNNVIFKNTLISSPPAKQLNNPAHTTNIFATTGRSWPSDLSQDQLAQIQSINQKMLSVLTDLKFKGFFGLDFFVDSRDQVLLIECNPRLTASFDFYSRLEIKAGWQPLLFFHIAQFLNINIPASLDLYQDRFFDTSVSGSQITKRNKLGKICQIIETC